MGTPDDGEGAVTLPILSIDWCVSIAFSFNKKVRQFKVFSSIPVLLVVELSQPPFTCSKLAIETLGQGEKYVQS